MDDTMTEGQLNDLITSKATEVIEASQKKLDIEATVSQLVKKHLENENKSFIVDKKPELSEGDKKEASVRWFKALARDDKSEMKSIYMDVESKTAQATLTENGTNGDNFTNLVPTPIREGILSWMYKYGIARQYASILPMPSETFKFPRLVSEGSFSIIDENTTYADLTYQMGSVTFTARKAGGMVKVTKELLFDANVDVLKFLYSRFGYYAAKFEDTQLFTGSGSGSNFTGILNNTNCTVYTQPTGNSTFTLASAPDKLLSLQDQLEDGTNDNAKWFMHKSILSLIRGTKATTNQYIYQNPQDSANRLLWGDQIVTSAVLPKASGTAVSTPYMIYGDLANYGLADRQQMEMQTLNERYAENGLVAVLVSERIAINELLPQFLVVNKTSAS